MSRRVYRTPQRGWSLVELAVALSISALLAIVLLSLIPLGTEVIDGERQQQDLDSAEQALLGYARTHGQLPAADVHDGTPWLPTKTLGLPARMRVRYLVETSLSITPGDLYSPLLPSGSGASTVNGLDFCMRLLLNQRSGVSVGGLGMPVAYYLAHSGVAGSDLEDAKDNWNNATATLPGLPQTGSGRHFATIAAGPGELSSRLACPDRIARAQGSAQNTFAAYSAKEMTEFNRKFREFEIRIAELSVSQAETARDIAIYDLAQAIVDEAIAITLMAAGWPPEGSAIAVGIKQAAATAISIASASKALADAQSDLSDANDELKVTTGNLARITAYRDKLTRLYNNANDTTIDLDKAGLSQ